MVSKLSPEEIHILLYIWALVQQFGKMRLQRARKRLEGGLNRVLAMACPSRAAGVSRGFGFSRRKSTNHAELRSEVLAVDTELTVQVQKMKQNLKGDWRAFWQRRLLASHPCVLSLVTL